MNFQQLDEEIKELDPDQLRYILETQSDYYSEEELEYIQKLIDTRIADENKQIAELLPKEIECPKCELPSEFELGKCKYCEYPFDTDSYIERARNIVRGYEELDDYETDNNSDKRSFAINYAFSVLIPLVGLIMGAIFLTRANTEEHDAGIFCIVISIVSAALYAFIAWLTLA